MSGYPEDIPFYGAVTNRWMQMDSKKKKERGWQEKSVEHFDVGWILDRWWSLETQGGKRKVNQKEHEQDVGSSSESSESFSIP